MPRGVAAPVLLQAITAPRLTNRTPPLLAPPPSHPQVHGDYTAEAAAAAASEKIERPAEEVVGMAPEEEA